jgi:hypothetical protein
VCDGSHESVVDLKPESAGQEYVLVPAGEGMPGLASWQSNPSRLPEPVQPLPHDSSFSPATFTHLPLRHWLSITQKQPPPAEQALVVLPLQLPKGHDEYDAAADVGHPPAGQGTEESGVPVSGWALDAPSPRASGGPSSCTASGIASPLPGPSGPGASAPAASGVTSAVVASSVGVPSSAASSGWRWDVASLQPPVEQSTAEKSESPLMAEHAGTTRATPNRSERTGASLTYLSIYARSIHVQQAGGAFVTPRRTGEDSRVTEADVRQALGIPAGARHVLVFGESSHWDPDWLLTSDEYYRLRVGRIMRRALDALEREPTRVYSIESVFFLKLYWERNPDRRAGLEALVNAGRLRLTGSANTTPDTLLPDLEALLRDYLYGQEWLRRRGMVQEPRVAYLPDNFGNSPALPSILRAIGVTGVAFCRLDGAHCPGCDYRPARDFPLRGSSAERLLEKERSLDFVWRDASGAEVVAHFHAGGYGHGDLLAHRGLTRWMGLPLAVPARSEKHVAARIASLASELAPLARTPYLFCPIGSDFVAPIDDLTSLVDGYNRGAYADTGIYVVNAGLDDYLDLVAFHRDSLPVVELDPNPYFTGFYASRPALKRRCRELVEELVEAEAAALAVGGAPSRPAAALPSEEGASDPWFWATAANHHDFITGTSPDRVHDGEQLPRVEGAYHEVRGGMDVAARRRGAATAEPADAPAPRYARSVRHLTIETEHHVIDVDEDRGGCITRVSDARTGAILMGGPSADLAAFHDTGGLWRMGQEYRGGSLSLVDRLELHPVDAEVLVRPGVLEVVVRAHVGGDAIVRTIWVPGGQPWIRVRVEGLVRPRRSMLLRFRPGPLVDRCSMGVPGGAVERPSEKLYAPTFWPAHGFARFDRADRSGELGMLWPGPGSVSFDPAGTVDCVVLRNATHETAFGWAPLLGFPVSGREKAPAVHDSALWLPAGRSLDDARAFAAARSAFDDPWDCSRPRSRRRLLDGLVSCDRQDAHVLAVKPAWRGPGVVVRVYLAGRDLSGELAIRYRRDEVLRATLCDARERDLEPLRMEHGAVRVPVRGRILSVRLETGAAT